MRTGGNHGVRRGPDLKPRKRRSDVGRPRGWSRTPTYNSWAQMRNRCNNPAYYRYTQWGGRGITVCERWASFENFLADMGERPPGHTLDRIDNDGPYEPGNCRWATPRQQSANRGKTDVRGRRTTVLTTARVLEIRDLMGSMSIQEIAAETGVGRHTVGTVIRTIRALQDPPPGLSQRETMRCAACTWLHANGHDTGMGPTKPSS